MHVVVTLVERDYLYGAAVLYNSLIANGFTGVFHIGFRGDSGLPMHLLAQMKAMPSSLPPIRWQKITTNWHFTNYKAQFIHDVFDSDPQINKVTYLDPDIVVLCPWSWMDSWCDHGPVICGDVNSDLPPSHPTRHQWSALLKGLRIHTNQQLSTYFNGGLVSLMRRDRRFVDLWHLILENYGSMDNPLDAKGDIGEWRHGGRWNPMHTPDQDALNMTAMAWEHKLSTFGSDAMGFSNGWLLVPHAIGSAKPWRRKYLRECLDARPPTPADKAFWDYSKMPIRLLNPLKLRLTMLSLKIASVLGRFYKRT